MQPKWIFERGVFDHGTPERMATICRELGMQSTEVVYAENGENFNSIIDVKKCKKLPFGDQDCVVMYGSFGMARYLLRHHAWIPGVWFDTEALSCRMYYSYWGEHLLQKNYAMMPLSEVRRQKDWVFSTFSLTGETRKIFMRPDSQLKQFAGQVVEYDGFDKFWSEAMVYGTPETLAVVARPQPIKNEWRLIIGDRKVISGSQYISDGAIEIKSSYSSASADFAEKVAGSTEWQPHPIYCMDICETIEGELRLLEIGSVNTCGLYDATLLPIIKKASEIAQREWEDVHQSD